MLHLGKIGSVLRAASCEFPCGTRIALTHAGTTEDSEPLGETIVKKQKGFSLIELLIVVAIILIIAAIAIPNLLRSKMAANEASAVGSLRTLNTACVTYSTSYGGFPSTLTELGGEGNGALPTSAAAQLIDNVLSGTAGDTSSKSGYNFTFSAGAADSSGNVDYYIINANPANPGVTGLRYFFTDQSGVIRAETAGPATVADSPI